MKPFTVIHGKRSTYLLNGCRCSTCRAGMATTRSPWRAGDPFPVAHPAPDSVTPPRRAPHVADGVTLAAAQLRARFGAARGRALALQWSRDDDVRWQQVADAIRGTADAP
jgi:hypothetical protein